MKFAEGWQPQLVRDGCQLIRGVLSPADVNLAKTRCEDLLQSSSTGVLSSRGVPYGARNVLELWPDAATLVRSDSLQRLVQDQIGPQAAVVRGLLFDKPPTRSWTLPWHRDRTIAVENIDVNLIPSGFSSPTRKAGTLHLCAPNELLEQMLTLRFSLDPMTNENGQLVVLPGSHSTTTGIETDADLAGIPSGNNKGRVGEPQPIYCDAGDVFVMRPLLAHSSNKSSSSTQMRRRVIHLEICNQQLLPAPLRWKNASPLFTNHLHEPS